MTTETAAQARQDLTEIVNLCAYLLDHAAHAGHDGRLEAARPIPGGDAMIMLSPVADYDTWARRITVRLEIHYRRQMAGLSHDPWMTDDLPSDPEPPLIVLGFWDDAWRHLNQHLPHPRPTIASAAGYLHQHMTRMSREPRARFNDFTRDLHQLRTRLEQILYAGERDEKGAPCLHCKAMLIRRCDPPKAGARDQGGLRDMWDCPRCRRTYGPAEYWNAVAAQYRANAPALTADDLATEHAVTPSTVRSWAARGHVKRRGHDLTGRVLYDVADVRNMASETADGAHAKGPAVA